MRLAALGLACLAIVGGVSRVAGQSFCDTFLPPLDAEQSYNGEALTQYDRLQGFLTVAAAGGKPQLLQCYPPPPEGRRLLAVNCNPVTGLFGRSLTKPFFDGSNPTWRSPVENGNLGGGNVLPNYTDPTAAGTPVLVAHLAQFFGSSGALNCTLDNSVVAYAGIPNQYDVHKNMPITDAVFTEFVSAVVDTALAYGVESDSPLLAGAGAVLNSFKRHTASPDTNQATICNQDDCACATGLPTTCKDIPPSSSSSSTGTDDGGAASSLSVSFLALASAAFLAIMRQ